MSINKFNAEGYKDPTAYEALTLVERSGKPHRVFRPIVYVCSPYSGDVISNCQAARKYSRFAVDRGCIPIAPHLLYPQFLDDGVPQERELGQFFSDVLMTKCAEVWVFGSKFTKGMEIEIKRALGKGYPLRYFNEDCEEVF